MKILWIPIGDNKGLSSSDFLRGILFLVGFFYALILAFDLSMSQLPHLLFQNRVEYDETKAFVSYFIFLGLYFGIKPLILLILLIPLARLTANRLNSISITHKPAKIGIILVLLLAAALGGLASAGLNPGGLRKFEAFQFLFNQWSFFGLRVIALAIIFYLAFPGKLPFKRVNKVSS